MVTLNGLHQVKLHAAFDRDFFALPGTVSFAAECCLFDSQSAAVYAAPVWEICNIQRSSTIDKIWKVKVYDIVSCILNRYLHNKAVNSRTDHPVRISGNKELFPSTQQLTFVGERNYFGTNDGSTGAQRHDRFDNRLALTVHGDKARDLNYGIQLRVREVAL